MTSPLETLIEINLNDIYTSLGIKRRAALDAVFRTPARRFAKQILEMDARVGRNGFRSGAAWAARQLTGGMTVTGASHVPTTGPVMLVSNHPGLADTLCLTAAIPREDMRIVAAYRPFLAALPNTSARLLYVKEDAGARMSAFREVISALKAGTAILTFPAGKIEPDPALRPDDARASLDGWIESIGLIARLMPDLRIVPVMVRGVFSPRAYRSPIAQRKPDLAERERMAAMLQVMWTPYQQVVPHVAFGPALDAQALAQHNPDTAAITRAIAAAARQLI
jgi:Acyltransferase